MLNRSFFRHLFWLFLLVFFWGCGVAATDRTNEKKFQYNNLIFTGAKNLNPSATDTKIGRPNFSWRATGEKHVVCAVFSEPIQVKDNRITNVNHVVWMWHSGFDRGREGNLFFKDGTTSFKQNGEPILDIPAKTLPKGIYYWAVWALDLESNPIYSSHELSFTVSESPKP